MVEFKHHENIGKLYKVNNYNIQFYMHVHID